MPMCGSNYSQPIYSLTARSAECSHVSVIICSGFALLPSLKNCVVQYNCGEGSLVAGMKGSSFELMAIRGVLMNGRQYPGLDS